MDWTTKILSAEPGVCRLQVRYGLQFGSNSNCVDLDDTIEEVVDESCSRKEKTESGIRNTEIRARPCVHPC